MKFQIKHVNENKGQGAIYIIVNHVGIIVCGGSSVG